MDRIYSKFPSYCLSDQRATTKIRRSTLAMIDNLIEDAFIEAVGCSEYDNLELYLLFGRMSVFLSSADREGTINQRFREYRQADADRTKQQGSSKSQTYSDAEKLVLLQQFLEYMGMLLLYPMVKMEAPVPSLQRYVDRTKQYFFDGSITGDARERYAYTDLIFDEILELIPDIDAEPDFTFLQSMMGGTRTHATNQATIVSVGNKPKKVSVTRRLLSDLNGENLPKTDFIDQINSLAIQLANDKNASLIIIKNGGRTTSYRGEDYDCAAIHKGIEIIENKPKINLNLKRAYQNIYNRYHININSYNSRFRQLLRVQVDTKESRKLYGNGIESHRFGDVKKRYWYKNVTEPDIHDIAIMMLIDGSGSMQGRRVEGARIASIVLHEVLRKQGIEHAIVEHRAIYDEPTVEHNILMDFQAREEEKYNLLLLGAREGTREGLSLYWAEQYLQNHANAEQKLIIVLSDGVPAHGIDGPECYVPPVSIKDTANAVRKIMKRGTNIIAVALDDLDEPDEIDILDKYSCYEQLRDIYPSVIACSDLKKLTGQLLGLITKLFG